MTCDDRNTLFIDHYGGYRRRPADVSAIPRNGIHALILVDGHILLIRPPGADWLELPGGGIEEGEAVAQALSRELSEEAGLQLPPDGLRASVQAHLQSCYYASTRGAFWIYEQRFWLVELSALPASGKPLERGHEREWLAIEDLHHHKLHHIHRVGIDRLLGAHG